MKSMTLNFLPLPHAIVFPTCTVTFKIENPKYLGLIRDEVEDDNLMVTSWTVKQRDQDGKEIPGNLMPRKVGMLVKISIHEDAGSYMVLRVTGICPVKINRIITEKPNIVVSVDPVDEDLSFTHYEEQNLEYQVLRETFMSSLIEGGVTNLNDYEDPEVIINQSILISITSDDVKQMLLEEHRLEDRLSMLVTVLRSEAGHKWSKLDAENLKTFLSDETGNKLMN